MPSRRISKLWLRWLGLLCFIASSATAQTNVILHLKNGDRLQGAITSENTNRVVISTSWATEVTVPLTAIANREIIPPPPTISAAPVSNAAPVKVTAPQTNAVAAVKPPTPAAKPPAAPSPKLWKASVDVGTDLLFGALQRQLYWGKLNFTYAEPYKSDPKKYFRTIFDYSADYGKTDGVKSTDRMGGSAKVDFDIGKRLYLYNLGSVGYDSVRLIDLQYQVGPGLGYHLFAEPRFVMNTEMGINYQAQDRSVGRDTSSVYGRAAEDVTWKITDRITLAQKFEIFPNLQETDEFRSRLEANISFALVKNLVFKVGVIDLFDTSPAPGVNKNELQIRSSVGVTF